MKLSIKVFLIATLFLFVGITANGQRGGGASTPEETAEKQTTQMVKKLKLTDDQTTKIQEINLVYAKKMQEAREANADNRSAMKEIMGAINKERNAEMATVLNDEQYKTFEEMEAKESQRRGRSGSRSRGS